MTAHARVFLVGCRIAISLETGTRGRTVGGPVRQMVLATTSTWGFHIQEDRAVPAVEVAVVVLVCVPRPSDESLLGSECERPILVDRAGYVRFIDLREGRVRQVGAKVGYISGRQGHRRVLG